MQKRHIWAVLVLLATGCVIAAMLFHYSSRPQLIAPERQNHPRIVPPRRPVIAPLSAADREAMVRQAVRDARKVATNIGMAKTQIDEAGAKARDITGKYLRAYSQ